MLTIMTNKQLADYSIAFLKYLEENWNRYDADSTFESVVDEFMELYERKLAGEEAEYKHDLKYGELG